MRSMRAATTGAGRLLAITLAVAGGSFAATGTRVAAATGTRVAPATGTPVAGAVTPPALRPVTLPRDQGAHPAYQVEWWYTAGTLSDHSGRRYFWFATAWAGRGVVLAKLNIVDLRADRIVLSREYVSPDTLRGGQTTMGASGFTLRWRAGGRWGRWSVDAPVPGAGRLRLSLTPVTGYVLEGPHGIVREGPGATSAYYSAPRLAATGTLTLRGRSRRVSGQGWFDHQWGNFLADRASWHWNWFACQFRDGSDLMLYQFITPAGRPTGAQSGTFVAADGAVSHPRRYTVTPLAPVIHPTGASGAYPLRWRLRVPSAGVYITLDARARHQFIANRYIPGFWEGAAAITSGRPGGCIVESTRETASIF